jgi:hypothetical protein
LVVKYGKKSLEGWSRERSASVSINSKDAEHPASFEDGAIIAESRSMLLSLHQQASDYASAKEQP